MNGWSDAVFISYGCQAAKRFPTKTSETRKGRKWLSRSRKVEVRRCCEKKKNAKGRESVVVLGRPPEKEYRGEKKKKGRK